MAKTYQLDVSNPITQEELKKLFKCRGGRLIRKVQTSSKALKGMIAGSKNPLGYIHVSINHKTYLAHRLVWLYYKGYFPEQLDHINGIKDDNRINNLREATQAQNTRNRPARGISKYTGVNYDKKYNKWHVYGKYSMGKSKFIGSFKSEADAGFAWNLWSYINVPRKDHKFLNWNRCD